MTIERQCRRLLRAYPADYRAGRGEEIIDTLMEVHAGRDRLPLRDRLALVMGGLRVRASENRRLPTSTNLRLATVFGLLLTVVPSSLGYLTLVASQPEGLVVDWRSFAICTAAVVTAALAWTKWHRSAAVLAVATAALLTVYVVTLRASGAYGAGDLVLSLAFLVVAGLLLGRATMPRIWIAFLLAMSLHEMIPIGWYATIPFLLTAAKLVPVVVILLWVAVDARPALGASISFAALGVVNAVQQFATGNESDTSAWWVTSSIMIPIFAIPAIWRMRRRSAL
jgi:hypothetical protein